MQSGVSRESIARSSGGTSSKELRKATLDLIAQFDLRGSVADFGAGKGDLIRSLVDGKRFSRITGLDLMGRPPDLPADVQWICADLNHTGDAPSSAFHVVTSLGLIEYLENPFAFAREVFRILRPGGIAILSTPNNESWRALLSLAARGHFVSFPWQGENINLTALVRRDLDRVLKFAGFRSTGFHYPEFGMVPNFAFSWQSISAGLFRGMRYSDDLIVTCRKES